MTIHLVLKYANPAFRARIIASLASAAASRFAEYVQVTAEGPAESNPTPPVGVIVFISPSGDFEHEFEQLRKTYLPMRTLVILPREAEISDRLTGPLDSPHIDLLYFEGSILDEQVIARIADDLERITPIPAAV